MQQKQEYEEEEEESIYSTNSNRSDHGKDTLMFEGIKLNDHEEANHISTFIPIFESDASLVSSKLL